MGLQIGGAGRNAATRNVSLRAAVAAITRIPRSQRRPLPHRAGCTASHLTPRCVKKLGTPTDQRIQFERSLEISGDERTKLVLEAREERDNASGGSTANLQPHAPKLAVGLKIEVLLGYFEAEKKSMAWFAGIIQAIEDSSASRTVRMPSKGVGEGKPRRRVMPCALG